MFPLSREKLLGGQLVVKVVSRGKDMRIWLLLFLFVVLAGSFYLGFGSPEYGEKTAEMVATLEEG